MNFLKAIWANLFRKKYRTQSGFECNHWKESLPYEIVIHGEVHKLGKSPFCKDCTTEYLNKYSTTCAECRRPILVGEPVGVSCIGSDFPYVHLTYQCTDSGGQFCGHWGEGKLNSWQEHLK